VKNWKTNKTAILLGIVIFILFTGSVAVVVLSKHHFSSGRYAEVYQDGNLIKTIDLTKVTESYTFTVKGENGEENVIEVKDGEIGIISASCPDHVCVNMGFIRDGAMPITCLPNHLVIKVTDTEKTAEDVIDGVAQ
jgi:hypothetical protein